MTPDGGDPTADELEHLFVNNESLYRVEAYLNRFNPIRTMRMESMEIRHSAILAWLLDPRETHGLDDAFLRAFLCEAMRGQSHLGSPTALEISQADLRDAEVRREWQNIDIFILLPRLNWAIVVENKFRSSQHSGQLSRYAQRINAVFETGRKAIVVRGVFLTLLDEEPEDATYAQIRYSTICEFLPRLISDPTAPMRDDVQYFLKHYLEILMEATGMSEERNEMETLARQLYRSHKKVLDFIVEHGATTEFIAAAEAVFGKLSDDDATAKQDKQTFACISYRSSQVSFLPSEWARALAAGVPWFGCENWWAGYPLICWIQLFEGPDGKTGQVRLFAEVGPVGELAERQQFITRIKQAAQADGLSSVAFQRGAMEEGKRFSRFLKENAARINDIHDAEEIERALRSLLDRFQPVFTSVGKILPEFPHRLALGNE